MRHENVVALLKKYGATVERESGFARGWQGTLNDHLLYWWVEKWWTRMVSEVEYHDPDYPGGERTYLLASPRDKVANGTLVKRFVERAAGVGYPVGKLLVVYGPDAGRRQLAPSLRVRRVDYPQKLLCTAATPVALAMGLSMAAGECPAGVVLDWLKDQDFVPREVE